MFNMRPLHFRHMPLSHLRNASGLTTLRKLTVPASDNAQVPLSASFLATTITTTCRASTNPVFLFFSRRQSRKVKVEYPDQSQLSFTPMYSCRRRCLFILFYGFYDVKLLFCWPRIYYTMLYLLLIFVLAALIVRNIP